MHFCDLGFFNHVYTTGGCIVEKFIKFGMDLWEINVEWMYGQKHEKYTYNIPCAVVWIKSDEVSICRDCLH